MCSSVARLYRLATVRHVFLLEILDADIPTWTDQTFRDYRPGSLVETPATYQGRRGGWRGIDAGRCQRPGFCGLFRTGQESQDRSAERNGLW